MDGPLISALITVFNCESFIREAIDSTLSQTIQNFELIIVNDGSIDNTASIINSYQNHKIRQITLPLNMGRVIALNIGTSIARGKFIALLDADDVNAPDRFARQISVLENNPEIVALGSNLKLQIMSSYKQLPSGHWGWQAGFTGTWCIRFMELYLMV